MHRHGLELRELWEQDSIERAGKHECGQAPYLVRTSVEHGQIVAEPWLRR